MPTRIGGRALPAITPGYRDGPAAPSHHGPVPHSNVSRDGAGARLYSLGVDAEGLLRLAELRVRVLPGRALEFAAVILDPADIDTPSVLLDGIVGRAGF